MLQWIQEHSIIVTIIVAILALFTGSLGAYIVQTIVAYTRRERKSVGYLIASRRLAEKGHKDLEIRYKDQEANAVHSSQVVCKNTGNRALQNFSVIISAEDGRMVDEDIEAPKGETPTQTKPDDTTLTVQICVIKPGEKFTVGFTLIDSKTGAVNVHSRDPDVIVADMLASSDKRAEVFSFLNILIPGFAFLGTGLAIAALFESTTPSFPGPPYPTQRQFESVSKTQEKALDDLRKRVYEVEMQLYANKD